MEEATAPSHNDDGKRQPTQSQWHEHRPGTLLYEDGYKERCKMSQTDDYPMDQSSPGSSATTLKGQRDHVGSLLEQNGVDLTKSLVIEPENLIPEPAADFQWTCESLQQVASDFFHASGDAITAGDIPHATQYYQIGTAFQQAHDAQCA